MADRIGVPVGGGASYTPCRPASLRRAGLAR